MRGSIGAVTGFLEFVLGVAGLGLGWATFGAPLLWLAIRSGRRAPERAKLRAVPWALAVAAWSGLVLGLGGFLWGAGIGDESAGAIAAMLFSIGFFGGAPVGGLLAWFFITRQILGNAARPS